MKEERKALIDYRLEQADESLDSAQILMEHNLGFNYGFEHGYSVFFVYGDDGFDEIWPKFEEYLNDPRWHYGETQVYGSWMGRKFAVLSWEEIQLINSHSAANCFIQPGLLSYNKSNSI